MKIAQTTIDGIKLTLQTPTDLALYERRIELAQAAGEFLSNGLSISGLIDFVAKHPQIEIPGAEPRYLLLGPTIKTANERRVENPSSGDATTDHHFSFYLLHTGAEGNALLTVTTTDINSKPVVTEFPQSELAIKINKESTVVRLSDGARSIMVLAPRNCSVGDYPKNGS
jgi:hypothetical protein